MIGIRLLACLLGCLALQACGEVIVFGHQVREGGGESVPVTVAATDRPSREAARTVQAVTLEVVPSAAAKIEADHGFSRDALLETIRATLRSRGVLVADATGAAPSAVVSVVDFETHPTTNAIVFGFLPGAGSLSATVRVEGHAFDVIANAPLRAPANEPAAFPLAPLYRDVAERVADALAGTPGRADDVARSAVPR